MNWTKVVLIFQAVVTLLLGIAFFASSIDFKIDFNQNSSEQAEDNFSHFKDKFQTASYVLLTVSLIELIILSQIT